MSDKKSSWYSVIFNLVFSYYTVRQAKIYSFKIALLYRIIQLAILAYIIGWSIVYKKGYQQFDTVSSAVTTKVKGLGYIDTSNGTRYFNGDDVQIFDTTDYVFPPIEYNSIFIMTNYIQTEQHRGVCDEDYTKVNCTCTTDSDCTIDRVLNNWDGLPTGKCINSSINSNVTVCEIASWCPVERDTVPGNIIQNIKNFTIFIKNDAQFKLFNKRERNMIYNGNLTSDFILTCAFQKDRSPFCPVFTVDQILRAAESNETEIQLMLTKGGVVQIMIDWYCNYDIFWDKQCVPSYSFRRFDLPFSDISSAVSSGFNFRYADKYKINETLYRILYKAYGIRFLISVTGTAGKFNVVPTLLTIGSGLGLLSLATILADLALLNLSTKKKFYQDLKTIDYKSQQYFEANKSLFVATNPNLENE